MQFTFEHALIAGGAVIVLLVVGLIAALWRNASAHRLLRECRAQVASLESESEALQLQLHHIESNYRQLHLDHSTVLKNLDDAGKELSDNQARCRGLEVEVRQLRSQVEEKQSEVSRGRADFNELTERYRQLTTTHAEMQARQEERENKHIEQIELLTQAREQLKEEFENLANRIFEDRGKRFTSTNRESLESLLKPFREQISGFQTRINEVHTESVKGQSTLEAEIRKVLDVGLEMNTQASNLAHALKGDKKTAGNWGEAQLQRTLELAGLQDGVHYESQSSFRDDQGKLKLPDFVIRLPDGKNLIVDSKVSLIDYDRAIAADTDEERTEALNAHAQAVRNHIDDLASKDYTNLPEIGSPDFVLMFMPVEPAYIEAMKHNKDLFNHGYKKGVIMVSHTTLMPILRTVANLWMIEKSNREAREISNRAGDIYNQVCLVAERLQKLGNTLNTASNHYNETLTGLAGKQGLYGKIERFQQLSTKANREMPNLEPVHTDFEADRLEGIVTREQNQEDSALPELGKPPTNISPIKPDPSS